MKMKVKDTKTYRMLLKQSLEEDLQLLSTYIKKEEKISNHLHFKTLEKEKHTKSNRRKEIKTIRN